MFDKAVIKSAGYFASYMIPPELTFGKGKRILDGYGGEGECGDMIDLHGQAGLPYVNRNAYTGSYQGMRYRLRKAVKEEDEKFLEAVVYPEPYGFEATAEEEKTFREFPFTQEGFEEAIAWLNEEYERQKERWEQASRV